VALRAASCKAAPEDRTPVHPTKSEFISEILELLKNNPHKGNQLVVQRGGAIIGGIQCSIAGAEDLLSILTQDIQPLSSLRGALQVISGFFSPTENLKYTDMLAYYRQREWRIFANMAKDGVALTRSLSEAEKELLLDLDQEFFSR
jgi:hypothetical protein